MDKTIFKNNKIKYTIFAIVAVIFLITAIFVSVCLGSAKVSVSDVFDVLLNKFFGIECDVSKSLISIIWDIRLPRIFCAVFIGMGLGVSGVIFQGILQNPLADPYTLGISTGASFGASVAIILNLYSNMFFPPSIFAFIGAGVTLFIVIIIARFGGGFERTNLIIAGIIVSSVLSSGVSFMKMLAGENVGAIIFWIMGSLSAKDWNDVIIVCPVVVICTIISVLFSRRLDIMALGDENAQALGVNAHRLRVFYLLIGAIITAVCVSISGVIGFIGLIIPHLLRFAITSKNTVLIPFSAICGAILLTVSDSITRIFTAGEVPVGVLTTLIGGPFFIFIFTRRGGRTNAS